MIRVKVGVNPHTQKKPHSHPARGCVNRFHQPCTQKWTRERSQRPQTSANAMLFARWQHHIQAPLYR